MNVAVVLFAASMVAAPYQGPGRARLLLLNADSCQFAISMKPLAVDASELAKFDDDRKKALATLEEDGPAAIQDTSNPADIQAAIKDFYAVADAYCKEPTQAGKAEVNAKEKVLDKLLEAAGR